MAGRVTQVAVEVLVLPSTQKARVTQVADETLVKPSTQKARVTQVAVESLTLPSTQKARVTKVAVEVLIRALTVQTGSFTADAVLRKTQTGSFTADAFFHKTGIGSFTADAILKQTTSVTFTADAVLKRIQSGSFTANANIQRIQSATFAADAVLKRGQTGSFTADAVLALPGNARITQLAIEGLIRPTSQRVRATQVAVESLLLPSVRRARVTQVAVEVLVNRDLKEFRADAVLKRNQTGSFTADASIAVTRSGSFTADAAFFALNTKWFFADAVIVKTPPSGSFTADAWIERHFKADAVLKAQVATSFTADAWIFAPEGSVNPTPLVSILVDGLEVAQDVVFGDATFTMLVNGSVGNFKFRVRDDAHSYNFVSGSEVTVDINGIRKFGGYLMLPSRMFAFDVDNTSVPSKVGRFWVLSGVDYNVLFAKRVVYDKADPANVNLRSWPAGSQDDVVIKYVFDHYTDLAADGATTAGVTHIGTPNPDFAGVIASGSFYFGEAMHEINRLISGVFYFNPYKELNFVDVDTPTAAAGLSDRPIVGVESGYREFEHVENGAGLVNDAMIWGAAAGVNSIAFARVQSTSSQDAHGLWQYGEYTSQLYKQSSVDKRADSLVNGTPQSKRGGKDDQVSWTVTTWDTRFSVGQKVEIESEVWGVSDVVPIRRMTLTFPVKNHPKLNLVLSHEIDEPWNLFEFYFPRIGKIGEIIPPTLPGPFDLGKRHWYFGTFTFLTGDGAFPQGIASMVPPTSTVFSDNKAGALFEFGGDYRAAMGLIISIGYSAQMGLLNIPVFPLGGAGGSLWSAPTAEFDPGGLFSVIGWGGIAHMNGTPNTGTFLQHAAANIAGPRDEAVTVNVTYWFDPLDWDLGHPSAGQEVINDTGNFGTGTQTSFFTTFPYEPGSLVVTVNGAVVSVTETNPATGEFTFTTAPAFGAHIVETYTAIGSASQAIEYGEVREDVPGTGSTLIQLTSAYLSGSARVWIDGFFQRPGFEFTESSPNAGQITIPSAPGSLQVVTVVYEANGPAF